MREAFTRREVGRMHWQWWKCEEGVFVDATDVTEVFREGGGDWSNFVGHFLVCAGMGGGVRRQKQWRELRRRLSIVHMVDSKVG